MELTLGEIAQKIGAELVGDPSIRIRNVAGIREAREGELSFVSNPRYQSYLESTEASAVIVRERRGASRAALLVTPHPYAAFLSVLDVFSPEPDLPPSGVHPTAVIDETVTLGDDVAIGPHVVIEAGAEIGDRTVVMAGAYVGHRSRIGADGRIYPNVVIREEIEIGSRVTLHPGVVVGSDGFGFSKEDDGLRKVPQIGRVVIEDDVEIGSNSAVDRATLGITRICRGARIDNLVHIAHNVEIGPHSILCAQVGISGSTRLGPRVILAGQAGLVGHIEIGEGARVGAQGGVTKSIPAGESVSGYPAMNHAKAQRSYASLRQLPDTQRSLRDLSRRVEQLEAMLDTRQNGTHQDAATPAESSRPGELDEARRIAEPLTTAKPRS